MKEYTRICARIDLDAIEYNLEMMRRRVPSDTKMIGVIKMDGYGHGAAQIARSVMEEKDYVSAYEQEAAAGKPRRYYHLTGLGHKILQEKEESWNLYARAVRQVLGGGACYAGA